MEKINIEQINFDLDYTGYIWYSNKQEPKLIHKISGEDFSDMPFIIEGNLYSETEGISIHIKNIDGAYFIIRVNVKNLSESQITEQEFVAHKLDGIKKIKMIQYWDESKEDDLLEGMTTLKPSWRAFIGFKKD